MCNAELEWAMIGQEEEITNEFYKVLFALVVREYTLQ